MAVPTPIQKPQKQILYEGVEIRLRQNLLNVPLGSAHLDLNVQNQVRDLDLSVQNQARDSDINVSN